MDKWAKIEEILNKLIETIFGLLTSFSKKLTPKKISSTYKSSKEKVSKKKESLQSTIGNSKQKSIDYALKQKDKSLILVNKSKMIAAESIGKAKKVDVKKIDWKKVFLGVFVLLSPFFGKIKTFIINIRPSTLLTGSLSSVIIGLTSVGIYTSTKEISEKPAEAREIASKVENATAVSTRSGYYKKKERTFTILNQFMPIYVDDVKKYKSVRIDFTIVASNKYIKEYFFYNLNKIKDRLNSTVEPIIPSFPLEAEGQYILKTKIKKELNQLLKDLKIKGEIDEVYVKHNLAG